MAGTTELGHIYIVAEADDTIGPVKIGIHIGKPRKTGRGGLNAGNPRELVALDYLPVPVEAMRWQEWLIHRRLRHHHVRGEWFDVRHLAEGTDWKSFLHAVIDGTARGLHPFTLVAGDHAIESVRQVRNPKRHFIARCVSGCELDLGPGKSMPTVLKEFARHSPVSAEQLNSQLAELALEVHHRGFNPTTL